MAALQVVLSKSASLRRKMFAHHDKTPLLFIVESGTLETVQLFVKFGADITEKDDEGKSAAHYALKNFRDPRIFEYLLEQGVDVNEKDPNGWQLLHHAVVAGNSKACYVLLRRGADLWGDNNDRKSPFFLALELADGHGNPLGRLPFGQMLFRHYDVRAKTVVKILIRHAAVYEYLNLKVSKNDIRELSVEENDYFSECIDELNSFKALKVYRGITMHGFFIANESALDNYYRNPEFLANCESLITDARFPKFRDWLQDKFEKQVERQKWLASVSELLHRTLALNDPHHLVIRQITSFLTNDELKNIGKQY